jgi:predicted SAM-dependent methyltransferase
MLIQLKSILKKFINTTGYEVRKISNNTDLDVYYSLFSKEDIEKKCFYNIGAGLFCHPAWTNIDYYSSWYRGNKIGISYDLFDLKPLPIDDNSANILYSSHTIEHINDEAAQNMFNEAYRILKTGGIIRLTTPNIDLCFKTVKNNDRFFWKQMIDIYSNPKHMASTHVSRPMKDVSLKQIFLFNFASQLSELTNNENTYKVCDKEFDRIFTVMSYEEALNYATAKCVLDIQKKYPVDHINWWNKDKLFRMLNKAGFEEIYLSAYGQSLSPVLRNISYFDNTCPYLSIYVEAQKL